ncbi:helix-turn-helix domain-containing protein [Flagellimonas pacifica]|uniref:AraC-type DNA-binding protein n=1 Tax=Flagellimonas pacifica TaxID=1247520 RepID=A0A285MZ56_9FLAO|nr:helix-turn-helix domain-containing protein [Allomuricauda parva]SNZ00761.1 AraC-type DNA-binding protein [Allomuricauda parva]
MFSFTNVIHIIIIFQGALLTLYILISNPKKNKGDFMLAAIIGTLTIQVLGLFLVNRGIASNFFQSINCAYGFLYGPLLLFYNKCIAQRQFAFGKVSAFHFLPFITICFGIWFTEGNICQPELYIGYVAHVLIYIFLCFLEVRRYKRVIKDNYSRLEWLNVGWLHWVFIIFSLIVLVDITQFVAFFLKLNTYFLENAVFLLMLAAINLLYFYGFTTSRNPFGYSKDDLEFSASLTSRNRINTTLEENKELIDRLEAHLLRRESFKNFNLTIATLANEIGIPKRKLSELINDHYDQNFVDFINTYRINRAKERFMNPQSPNETILEVLYEVGFNSKSSFNTAFKKKTGITPSEFKSKYN